MAAGISLGAFIIFYKLHFHISDTFVFKAMCIGHLKSRLLPDLNPSQNVPKHSLFKWCKFHEKINGRFFARGQNVLYNALKIEAISPTLLPISIDLM